MMDIKNGQQKGNNAGNGVYMLDLIMCSQKPEEKTIFKIFNPFYIFYLIVFVSFPAKHEKMENKF